jgi:SAM-dependent methyltransferase
MSDELLNESFPLRDAGWSNGDDNGVTPVHRWYPFKEAFSPRLVERAASESDVEAKDTVLDPFCGSGTVPVAAAHRGAAGVGVEVNPFMAFVSRTKLLRVDPSTLRRALPRLVAAAKRGDKSPLERFSTFSSAGGAEKWLFNPPVLRAFEGAWWEAASLGLATRDLMRLALLAAAMDVCNAKRDGKCLRYKSDWSDLRYGRRAFNEAFEQRVLTMAEDLRSAEPPSGTARISLGDSRRDLAKAFRGKFKLCVTSPPYLNSFDYSDVYRPELFLGKFVSSNEELRTLRFKTVRSHVQVDWARPVREDFGALYTECVGELRERANSMWNRRLPQMVQAYFEDMSGVLRWLRKHARDDAKLWIVVSTSAYAGIEVPVDLILGELGSRAGWYLRDVGVLRYLRTSGQHWNEWSASAKGKPRLRESVIIFDASAPRRTRRESAR